MVDYNDERYLEDWRQRLNHLGDRGVSGVNLKI